MLVHSMFLQAVLPPRSPCLWHGSSKAGIPLAKKKKLIISALPSPYPSLPNPSGHSCMLLIYLIGL